MSTASQSLVGQTIADRYHVISLLGEGGMGRVYLAEHMRMGRKSAVKVLSPELTYNAEAISRFHREAANASRINHPNVAAIYDFGETSGGLLYLAMEFVEGPTLRAMLEREPRLDLLRAVKLIKQAADALAAAHHLGLVHRDIKPDNIMITRNLDGSELVKVVDFGIAKTVDERSGSQTLTTVGVSIGTPEYMSPEQLAGEKLDARTDVYSLGLVLFHMLTGGMPFPRLTSRETFVKRLSADPRRLDEVAPDVEWPVGIQRALDRALALDLGRRYSSVGDFGREIVEAAESNRIDRATRPASMPRVEEITVPTPVPRSGGGLTTSLIVFLAAAALLIFAEPVGRGILRAPVPHTAITSADSVKTSDSAVAGDSAAVSGDSLHPTTAEARQPDTTRQATIDTTAKRVANDSTPTKRDSSVAAPVTRFPSAGVAESRPAVPSPNRALTPAPVDSTKREQKAQSLPNSTSQRAAAPVATDSASRYPRPHRLLRFNGDTAFALTLVTRNDSTSAEAEDVQGHFERARQLLVEGHPAEAQFELLDAAAELRLLRSRLDIGAVRDLDAVVRRVRQQTYQACLGARDQVTDKDVASRYQCERVFPRVRPDAGME